MNVYEHFIYAISTRYRHLRSRLGPLRNPEGVVSRFHNPFRVDVVSASQPWVAPLTRLQPRAGDSIPLGLPNTLLESQVCRVRSIPTFE